MHSLKHGIATAALISAGVLSAACGKKDQTQNAANGEVANPPVVSSTPNVSPATATPVVDSTKVKHHSKLGGALVGAAVGHVLGGHAAAGAAAGALVQHERNKHP